MQTLKLTKAELKEVLGGFVIPPPVSSTDIINKNTISGCMCTYKNQSVIENTNNKIHCSCVCI